MKIWFVLCFALALMFAAVAPLQAQTDRPAEAGAVPATPVIESTEKRDHRQVVCVITGKVTGMQAVEKTPWSDGTPSTITITEVHLSVATDSRKPQRAGVAAADCPMPDNGGQVYKLCSPTQVKLGDRIVGTEGLATGSESALGCLFDVIVVPDVAATP